MLNQNQTLVLNALKEALDAATQKALEAVDQSTPNSDVAFIMIAIERAISYVLKGGEDGKE